MDYFVSSVGADPVILWAWRLLFFGLVAYVLWTMYAQRRPLQQVWLACWDRSLTLGRSIWARWGPLFATRTFWGGAIVYITWRLQVTLPPEALGFATDVLYAFSGTFGLILLTIGRIFAKGPMVARIRRDEAHPITNVHNSDSAADLVEGGDAFNAESMREFADHEAERPGVQTFGTVDVPPLEQRQAENEAAPPAPPKRRRTKATPNVRRRRKQNA